MKRFKKQLATLVSAGLMTALTLNFNACTEQSPLNSELSATGFKILKSQNTRLNKAFQRSKSINKGGGKIEIGDKKHGISKLVIPKGALADEVLIAFWWESTGFLEGGADFSPHGTNFNEPVRLELSYKAADLTGVNESDLEIRYYNEKTGQWELIGNQIDRKKKVVIGFTDHFSRYAIGAGE